MEGTSETHRVGSTFSGYQELGQSHKLNTLLCPRKMFQRRAGPRNSKPFFCKIPHGQSCGLDDLFLNHTPGTAHDPRATLMWCCSTFRTSLYFSTENYIRDSLNFDCSSSSLVIFLVIMRMLLENQKRQNVSKGKQGLLSWVQKPQKRKGPDSRPGAQGWVPAFTCSPLSPFTELPQKTPLPFLLG